MPRKLSLKGQKFGRLIVVELGERTRSGRYKWLCKCECGNLKNIVGTDLKNGHSSSCGCLQSDVAKEYNTIHGNRYSAEYSSWADMKKRCTNPNSENYKNYGGRGIKVCDRWLHSFENFYADMGPKPGPEYSLDRYPNNETGNYGPTNCRWGTDEEQCKNRRSNRWIEFDGIKMVLSDWARFFEVSHSTLFEHLESKTFDQVYNFYKDKRK